MIIDVRSKTLTFVSGNYIFNRKYGCALYRFSFIGLREYKEDQVITKALQTILPEIYKQ